MNRFFIIGIILSFSISFCAEQNPIASCHQVCKNCKVPGHIKEIMHQSSVSKTDLEIFISFLSNKTHAANPAEAVYSDGLSVLVHSTYSPCKALRDLVYACKPDINRTCKGRTAFFFATSSTEPHSIEIMKELIAQNADTTIGWDNITPRQTVNEQLVQAQLNYANLNRPNILLDNEKKLKDMALSQIELFQKKEKLLAVLQSDQQ